MIRNYFTTMLKEAKCYANEHGLNWIDVYTVMVIDFMSEKIAKDEKLYKKLREKYCGVKQ